MFLVTSYHTVLLHINKVCSFLEHSGAILRSFKIVIICTNTSAEIRTKSADLLLKMITILKELRIAQLCSENERTLIKESFSFYQKEGEGLNYNKLIPIKVYPLNHCALAIKILGVLSILSLQFSSAAIDS